MDILESWTDTVKFYSIKIWPRIEEWKIKLFSYNFWLQMFQKLWWGIKRQTYLTQLAIVFVSVIGLFTMFSTLYVKITKGVCKSKNKLIGKTVLITGANSGKYDNYFYNWCFCWPYYC